MNLFQKINITLNSGKKSDFKIECVALTDEDWECLAYLISKKVRFKEVISVPTGGDRFAKALTKYCTPDSNYYLVCDDVLTTGASMEIVRNNILSGWIKGVVVFARGKCPDWITPIFKLNV